jgi:hypothetical protein
MPGLAPLSERVVLRLAGSTHSLRGAGDELLRVVASLALLPHQAWISLDAIARVLHRRFITRRRLLEWQTAEQTSVRFNDHYRRTITECSVISAAALLLLIVLAVKGAFWTTVFFVAPWIFSTGAVVWLGRKTPGPMRSLDESDTAFLSKMARLTWRFFDDLVGPEDQWLPPDNTQLSLRVEVAHRTSPTNIGLWLTLRSGGPRLRIRHYGRSHHAVCVDHRHLVADGALRRALAELVRHAHVGTAHSALRLHRR